MAIRNIFRNKKNSALLVFVTGIIAFLFFIGNSVIARSERGLRESYIESITGDVLIQKAGDVTMNLFGANAPVVDEYFSIPLLPAHDAIAEFAAALPEVAGLASQVSATVFAEAGGLREAVPLAGIDGSSYFGLFPGIVVERGRALRSGESGAMLSAERARRIEARSGAAVEIGSPVLLTSAGNSGFKIREAPVVGIYSYKNPGRFMNEVVFVDVDTARALSAIQTASPDVAVSADALSLLSADIDDLFTVGEQGAGSGERVRDTTTSGDTEVSHGSTQNYRTKNPLPAPCSPLPSLAGRHLVQPSDFTLDELERLFTLARRIEADEHYLRDSCRGRLLGTLFFEPSTRTRLSFEAAMLRLGGTCLGFSEPGSSSAAKGESLSDTVRIVSCYADLIVMRSPKEGAALLASRYAEIPVINAGDGGHHHPTQTLTDLLTIQAIRPAGISGGLCVGFCGDLKFGRTVHSLATTLARYPGVSMVFISPPELTVPDYITAALSKHGIPYEQTDKLEKVIGSLDVLYMTRVQKERFFNEEDYIRLKDSYILTREKMALAREDMIVLHPLPRVNEIAVEVDADRRAVYFRQAKYGMYVRMALIASILGVAED
jgi:aspartate carbamoyltransferase catalytic subunit